MASIAPAYSLKQIRYFAAVARFGSVSRAAEHLKISQPSISAAVGQLEHAFGLGLFVRHHARGLSLTPAGQRFLKLATRLLSEADYLDQSALALSGEVGGDVEVGCILTLAPLLMPPTIGAFARQHPRARINCHELDHKQLVEGLLQGQLEMAVTYDMAIPEQLDFRTISQYPAYALVAPSHPLARQGHAYVRQLAEQPMILLDLPHTAEYFQSIFLHLGIKPQIRYRTPSPHMARSLVANGLGYTLLNAPLKNDRSLDGKPLRAIKLDDDLPSLTLGIASIHGHRLTRVAAAFVDHLLSLHARMLGPRTRRKSSSKARAAKEAGDTIHRDPDLST